MKRVLSLALAAGLFLATAGAAEARHHFWGGYGGYGYNNYGYGYSNPWAGYYPSSAYNNGYYGYNPYGYGYGYGGYPYYGHHNTLRSIGNALLRGWF